MFIKKTDVFRVGFEKYDGTSIYLAIHHNYGYPHDLCFGDLEGIADVDRNNCFQPRHLNTQYLKFTAPRTLAGGSSNMTTGIHKNNTKSISYIMLTFKYASEKRESEKVTNLFDLFSSPQKFHIDFPSLYCFIKTFP